MQDTCTMCECKLCCTWNASKLAVTPQIGSSGPRLGRYWLRFLGSSLLRSRLARQRRVRRTDAAPHRLVRTEARSVHLDDHRVVHEPIDGGGRGHRVLEDAVPLRED